MASQSRYLLKSIRIFDFVVLFKDHVVEPEVRSVATKLRLVLVELVIYLGFNPTPRGPSQVSGR